MAASEEKGKKRADPSSAVSPPGARYAYQITAVNASKINAVSSSGERKTVEIEEKR